VLTAGAVGGALVIGLTVRRFDRRAGAAGGISGVLNAFVRIGPGKRVTLVMPKVEMGQGVYTALAMLIAEELEVGLDAVNIEAAPPNPAVYGFVPDPAADEGLKFDQSTGTSLSIIQCWTPLRQAGATARLMLIEAAARRWGVPAASCHAEAGSVVHADSGRRLGYDALGAEAAALPVPASPPLKPPQDFRLIGHATRRLDGATKVDGSARFGIDARPAGAKVAVIAIAPVVGGSVASSADRAALSVRGVRQVVNEGDLVAVVGDDTWAAMQGMKALAPRWNDGANADVQQAALVAELESAVGQAGAVALSKGAPVESGRVAMRVEATYHQPFLAHATLEPMNCTVDWRNGECEIWTGTQAPDRAVDKLAALNLKPEQIILHNEFIGGGFGRRLEVDGVVLAARVARHVRGPVQVLWSREEDIRHDRYRPYYVDHLTAALDAHGAPLAWRHTIAGAGLWALYYGERTVKNGVDADAVTSAADLAYPLDNIEVRFVRHDPRGVPTGWWRGVGATRSVFAVESFVDELAAAARQDPVSYRRALLKEPRMRAVLDLAADRAGWGTVLPAGSGRGVSIQYAFGSYLALVAEASVDGQGNPRVARVVCAMDCGQVVNPDGVRAQLEGGVTFGLSAALTNEITIADGRVQQGNFNDFLPLRIADAPRVEVHLIASGESPGGVGETGTACVAAALCNAIYAATGRRVRRLPVSRGLKG
jgi:CO/xanthine dehydrogenase Mo-binding subunit